jgi:2-dehydropantoate 2-reductase
VAHPDVGRYIIYGAGAIGGAIGGRLFEHGYDVTLIARGPHYAALRDRGLELVSPGERTQLPVPAVDSAAAARPAAGDVLILTTKSQDTAGALNELAAVADPDIVAVCAQNGVDNERQALRRFRRVYAMCVMLPATHLQPGVVEVGWAPPTGVLDLGRYPAGRDDTASQVAAALEASTFLSRPEPSVMRRKYQKLLLNLGNALDAACGPAGRASELYRLAKAEGEACYRAAGIDFASDEEDRARRDELQRRRAEASAGGSGSLRRSGGGSRPSSFRGSSSWQSLARGTGSIEADYLNGEIVLLGRQHDVPTPVNELLQRVANHMARAGIAPGSYTVEDLLAQLG